MVGWMNVASAPPDRLGYLRVGTIRMVGDLVP